MGDPHRLVGILLRVNPRRREVFRAIERKFMVATQATGALGKRSDLGLERLGQATAFGKEHLRDIVNAGWLDTMGSQETLQGQFNDLLTLADDIRPTGLLEKHVDRPQPGLGSPDPFLYAPTGLAAAWHIVYFSPFSVALGCVRSSRRN